MTAADRIAQIRARVEAATEGPWRWMRVNHWSEWTDRSLAGVERHPGGQRSHEVLRATPSNPPGPADAAFIANARSDVPALLAAVEAVLMVHRAVGWECEDSFCSDAPHSGEGCEVCSEPYPCPTVRAIEGALS